MIKRAKKQNNFTSVYNEFIVDNRLTARAKGVLIWILSKPDDWVIYKSNLYKNFKEGRESIWKAFNELIEFGYVIPIEVKSSGDGGRFEKGASKKAYIVYEVSIYSDKFSMLYPDLEPSVQRLDSRLLLNTDITPNTEKKNKTNTENNKENRFFLFLKAVGLDKATESIISGMRQGQIIAKSLLPTELLESLIDRGCKITPNGKVYLPSK